MKLAITAFGNNLDAEIDPRFGRAQYILITDPQGIVTEVIDNAENRAAMGGAGISAAKLLADRRVDVLLTGRCGPNALAALNSVGIKIYEVAAGTVRKALEDFNRGQLSSETESAQFSGSGPGQGLGPGQGMGRGMGRGQGMGRGRGTGQGRRRI